MHERIHKIADDKPSGHPVELCGIGWRLWRIEGIIDGCEDHCTRYVRVYEINPNVHSLMR